MAVWISQQASPAAPAAKAEDWKLVDAGIRVQAIKKTDGEAGIVRLAIMTPVVDIELPELTRQTERLWQFGLGVTYRFEL